MKKILKKAWKLMQAQTTQYLSSIPTSQEIWTQEETITKNEIELYEEIESPADSYQPKLNTKRKIEKRLPKRKQQLYAKVFIKKNGKEQIRVKKVVNSIGIKSQPLVINEMEIVSNNISLPQQKGLMFNFGNELGNVLLSSIGAKYYIYETVSEKVWKRWKDEFKVLASDYHKQNRFIRAERCDGKVKVLIGSHIDPQILENFSRIAIAA